MMIYSTQLISCILAAFSTRTCGSRLIFLDFLHFITFTELTYKALIQSCFIDSVIACFLLCIQYCYLLRLLKTSTLPCNGCSLDRYVCSLFSQRYICTQRKSFFLQVNSILKYYIWTCILAAGKSTVDSHLPENSLLSTGISVLKECWMSQISNKSQKISCFEGPCVIAHIIRIQVSFIYQF